MPLNKELNTPKTNKSFFNKTKATFFRFAVIVSIFSALLYVVARTGAQSLFTFNNESNIKLLKNDSKTKADRKILNFDIRYSGKNNLESALKNSSTISEESIIQTVTANKATIESNFAKLKAKNTEARIEGSDLTGAVEVLQSSTALTKAHRGQKGIDIVRNFISENQGIYGLNDAEIADLNFIGESISPESGIRMVRVEQIINERPVFQSETRFILDRDGRIISSLGLIVPNATTSANALENLLTPQAALKLTMDQLKVPLEIEQMNIVKSEENGFRNELRVNNSNISGKVTSKIVYFPIAPGVLIPAWSQIVFGVNEDWYVLVDARDGTMLWRKNIRSDVSTHDARFRVYVQPDGSTPADSPAPQSPAIVGTGSGTQFAGIAPSIVSMFSVQNLIASPNGWIDDCPGGVCTATQTQTLGNNVLSCLDRAGTANVCDTDAASVLDGNGRPTGNPDANSRNRDFLGTAPRDFQTGFLPAPQGGNPEAGQTPTGAGSSGTNAFDQFRRASVAQQFYNANWYHDKLFALGFNPAAGNFQNDNFGGGGIGNDRVLIDVQDASGTNNANFSTPPDGGSGRSQMFRFTGPTVDRDGGLDAEILIHELTHGTSNRLVGNAAGLQWAIGQGLGEGWSDFYALALLNNTNADDPNGNYASGAYATYKAFGVTTFTDNYLYGIRRFPFSTNNSVNPLTWADVDQATNDMSGGIPQSPLNFNAGGALEVHNSGELWTLSLWEMRSRIIAANANNVPAGNQIALQIVTDAMKLTPISPTFIQARDALITADCTANACANEQSIWDAFADRGLGYGAAAPQKAMFGYISGHIGLKESFQSPNLDVNTITIADPSGNNSGFVDPNEPFNMTVNLKNPWRNASKSASLAPTAVSATLSSTTPGVTIVNGTSNYPTINANSNASGTPITIRAPGLAACGASINFTLTVTSSLGTVARDFTIRMGQPSGTLAPVTYTRSGISLAIPDNNSVGVKDTLNITDDFEIADIDLRVDNLTHPFVGDVSFMVKGPNGFGTDLLSLLGGVTDGGTGDNFVNTVIDDEATNDLLPEVPANAPFTRSYRPIMNSPSWATAGFPTFETVPQLSQFDGSSTLGTWTAVLSDQAATDTGTLTSWSLIVTPRNFVCAPFVPTAGNVEIGGTVTDSNGQAIARANVSIIDPQGNIRNVKTNSFGAFKFDEIPSGQTYTLNAAAKGFTFVPQVLSINEEIGNLTLIAQ